MARFEGVAHIEEHAMRVEVEREPRKLRVTVEDRVVLDDQPVSPPETVTLGNGMATLRFRDAGSSEECTFEVRGRTFALARLEERGRPEPKPTEKPTEAQLDEDRVRLGGLLMMVFALIQLFRGWPDETGHYYPKLLDLFPGLFLWGLAMLVAPRQLQAFLKSDSDSLRPLALLAIVLSVGVSMVLSRWVLRTFMGF